MLQLILMALSAVCACAPMLCFLVLVWSLDRYDREPVWLLATAFVWGAVGAIGIAIIGSGILGLILTGMLAWLDAQLTMDLTPWIAASGAVVVAPLVEEPAKAIILVAVIFNRDFDNMTDGFVYGAAAGLGFGMTENFLYFLGSTENVITWSGTVLVRTFYSAVMHATATSIVGAALGFGRFRGYVALIGSGLLGLCLATGVHAVWNGLISVGQVGLTTDLFWLDLILFPIEVLLVAIVFEVCVLDESRTIRRELNDEVVSGVIPEGHPEVLSSWIRRLGRSWVGPRVNRRSYIRSATTLAMRKKQLRLLGDGAPAFYREEVKRLRADIIRARSPQQQPSPARTT